MSVKLIVAILIFGATTYAFGRYSAPTKVVTEVHTVEVEKKVTDSDTERNKHVTTQTKEVVKPDGTKETDTTVTEDTTTDKKVAVTDDTDKDTKSKSVMEYIGGNVSISAMAGLNLSTGLPVYGGHIQGRVLGPFTSGIWGLSNGVLGVSVGLVF